MHKVSELTHIDGCEALDIDEIPFFSVCVSERADAFVGVKSTRFVEFRHLTNDMKRALVPFVLLFILLMSQHGRK